MVSFVVNRMNYTCGPTRWRFSIGNNGGIKGVVNCQTSRDKGPPEGNSTRG